MSFSYPPPAAAPTPPPSEPKRPLYGKVFAWVAIVFGSILCLVAFVDGFSFGSLLLGIVCIAAGVVYLKGFAIGRRKLWIAPAVAILPALVVAGLTAPPLEPGETNTGSETTLTTTAAPRTTAKPTTTRSPAPTTTIAPTTTVAPVPFVAPIPTTTEDPIYTPPPVFTPEPEPEYVPPAPVYEEPAPVYEPPVDVPDTSIGTVSPGAFCSNSGAVGVTKKGTPMVCAIAKGGRLRWISS